MSHCRVLVFSLDNTTRCGTASMCLQRHVGSENAVGFERTRLSSRQLACGTASISELEVVSSCGCRRARCNGNCGRGGRCSHHNEDTHDSPLLCAAIRGSGVWVSSLAIVVM